MVAVCEHPEPEPPHVVSSQHIQEVGGVGKVYVVVAGPVREKVVRVMEACHVCDGGDFVACGVEGRGRHIAFGVNGVCENVSG